MNEIVRAALVIARRDYIASVWSKTFLLFLIGPLLPILASMVIVSVMQSADKPAPPPALTVIAPAPEGRALEAARAALATRVADLIPELHIVAPRGTATAQARALLKDRSGLVSVVAFGRGDGVTLVGAPGAVAGMHGETGLLWDEMRRRAALGHAAPPPVRLSVEAVAAPAETPDGTRAIGKYGQTALLILTMMLAGMLLSNLIEEKSSKVIEILAAAVPVDAIFLGKLAAMLGMSLTAIAVWGVAGFAVTAATGAPLAALPAPAVGWPAFVALGIVYFISCYLLLGSLFLGIGAQASTVREVQTLSMPVTMGQVCVFALGVTAVGVPDSGVAIVATIFPWSSPFAMLGRAALDAALWPHLLAILWQAAWIALIIKVASLRFRRSVLKSGKPARRARRSLAA